MRHLLRGMAKREHMTHDELLACINEEIEVCDPSCNSHKADNQPWLALRAVVELHKPRDYKSGNWCIGCNADYEYPCPTIQAIEEELK